MPTPQPQLSCILVNWNNWQDTAACLAALHQQDYPSLSVLVIDNHSTNDSVAQLRAAHPWATYIENPSNDGFARACNHGARRAFNEGAHFIWLLNNDTIAPPDTASKLVCKALSNPPAGVIGSVLFYLHRPIAIQAWGGGSINLWTGYNRHYTVPTLLGPRSYLTFASVLIRRELFDQLNGLYEGTFMYYEDADFCLRARAAGWQLAVAEDTAILHKEGGSHTSGTAAANFFVDRATTLSGLLFLERHAAVPALAGTLFLILRLGKRVLTANWKALGAVIAGVQDWRQRQAHPPR